MEQTSISVAEMLKQHNSLEEELAEEAEALQLARLTLYRFPVDWYREQAAGDGFYTLKRFLVRVWYYALFGGRPQTPHDEAVIRSKVEQRFLVGRCRDAYAAAIEQKQCSWPRVWRVAAEVIFRNTAADACERFGLDYALDAWAAGAPLEHVFPELV